MKRIIYCFLTLLPAIGMLGQSEELRFDANGTFKIVQFTDVHYNPDTEGAARSVAIMRQTLAEENPDLVVFTGDVVVCNPQQRGWDEALAAVTERNLPFAVVLGNHDDEHDWTRRQIFDYLATKPRSLAQSGPPNVKGTGNYVSKISGRDNAAHALLYFFDSNAYNQVGEQKGYDWFAPDQVDWYRTGSHAFTQSNGGKPYPALAFFHIPLQEYTLLADTTKNYVTNAPVYGLRGEKECPGILNTGMFAAMVESGDVMGVFVGHDHDNDYIGCLNHICLAYGRFTGTSNSYNKIGSGARVIVLKENLRAFETWIRTEQNQTVYRVRYPEDFAPVTKQQP